MLKTGNGPQLLSWLEVQSTVRFAKAIAALCAANSQTFDGLSTGLRDTVISPYLLFRALAPIGNVTPPLPAGTVIPGWIQTVVNLCVSNIQPALKTTLSLRATGGDGSAPATTTIAPPLVIPVMPLRSSDALTSDPLHGIRGVGVLMRRQSTPPMDWSCLNIVAPVGQTTRPLLVASGLGYNQKLLTGFLVYDNGPLPCETLLHNYMAAQDRLTPPPDQMGISPVMCYAPYEGVGTPLYGTPMLEAGKSYDVASFAVSNAGAVPVELRDGYPAKLKPLQAGDALPGSTPANASGVVQTIPYFRTVPVGAAEARDQKGRPLTDTAGLFPRLPQSVWPRSIEAFVPRIGVGLLTPTSDPTPAKPPLLMVVPSTSNTLAKAQGTFAAFTFSLKWPSLEPQTWDRTVGYQKDRVLRASILDWAYSKLAKNNKAEITDPLIKQVDICLYPWAGVSGAAKWGSALGKATYSVDDVRKSDNGVLSVETYAIQVSVNAGSGQNDGSIQVSVLTDSGPKKSVTINSLAEGEVFLLEATFTLDNSVSAIMQNYPKVVTGYQLLIEIASATMPTPTDLVSPVFTVSPLAVSNVPDQRVSVQLKPGTLPMWRNIHRVDFLRQTWYWTGRTQPQPLATPGDLADYFKNDLSPGYYPAEQSFQSKQVQEWAKIEFAERSWTDHVELSSVLKEGAFGWQQDMSLDLRATYLRFAPRVYSRYEGAFAGFASQAVTTIGNGGDDVWAPCFIRSRAHKLEMPRFKALIPLTESTFAPGTPGILAVFDGPAYDQAGLAERLQVSIAKVSDPEPTVTTQWKQSGPDFLMSNEKPDPDPTKQVQLTLLALGPIGHTLDEPDSSFPKFVSHSWIIRPVKAKDPNNPDPVHDFSWWFANLEFQLKIDDASSVFKGADIGSQSTIGSWIQFLPGFQDANHKSDRFDQWSLQWESGAIAIRDDLGRLVKTGSANERHLRHYLLVTRTVLDVTGKSREAYVGVAKLSGTSWVFFPDVAPFSPDKIRIRGRFLDVRSGETGVGTSTDAPPAKPPVSEAEFWQRILGGNNVITDDVNRASIVSLSPIIRQKGGSQ
jgi:hypothetical protein